MQGIEYALENRNNELDNEVSRLQKKIDELKKQKVKLNVLPEKVSPSNTTPPPPPTEKEGVDEGNREPSYPEILDAEAVPELSEPIPKEVRDALETLEGQKQKLESQTKQLEQME
ncbi:MAG: hypothetical protein ACTSUE_16185, partial [Promethearchaeota archaeon]